MAHTLFTPQQAARAALARLKYMSVLPRTVRQDFSSEFVPGRGHVVNVRGPITINAARVHTAANRANRDDLVFDDLSETTYPVTMTDQVYKGVRIPDDFNTFTLEDATRQVFAPSADAVVEGIVDPLYTAMQGVSTDASIPLLAADGSNALTVVRKARRVLNGRKVPLANRFLAIGAGLEESFLSLDKLIKVNESGSTGALRAATIGDLMGFTVVVDQGLPAYFGCAYVADAFAHVTRPPVNPVGAAQSATVAADGFSLRWLRHYNAQKAEDQSLVDAFVGARVLDPARAVLFGGKLVGGSVTVTPDEVSLAVGETTQLVVTDAAGDIIPNRLVAFTSATARQTVSADGVVTAVTAGAESNVTATFDAQSDTCAVTVTS